MIPISHNESKSLALGPLETAVMDFVWERGELSVHDVVGLLGRPLSYSTVMTTLDRLYKKGMLTRRKRERAFMYSARLTRSDWERKRAGVFMAGLLSVRDQGRDRLISCIVDALGHDERVLDELEKKIRQRRQELKRS